MKKIFFRLLAAVFTLCFILGMGSAALAETSEPYVFVYKGMFERGLHAYYHRDLSNPQACPEDVTQLKNGLYCVFGGNLMWLAQKKADGTVGSTPEDVAYCCDLNTQIVDNAEYRRIMLEECDYFANPEDAAMVRSIVLKGYWREADGTSNIEELRSATGLSSLTELEALAATQHAIWDYGNSGSSAVGMRYAFTYNRGKGYIQKNTYATENNIHGDSVDKSYGSETVRSGKYSATSAANIEAMYQYLKNLSPVYSYDEGAGSIIFSDGFFVDWYSITTEEGADTGKYSVTLSFTLEGDLEEGSSFKLDITQLGKSLYSGALPAENASLTDSASGNALSRDGGKKFTLSFVYDMAEEGSEGGAGMLPEVKLSLTGTQDVVHGVYFYEPEEGYTASQCLVGKACGLTPVSAAYTVPQQPVTPDPTPAPTPSPTPAPTHRHHHHSTPTPELYFEAIPKTGDASIAYLAALPIIAAGMVGLKKKRK